MDLHELNEEIEKIKEILTKPQRYNFEQCVDCIKQGKYRHLRGYDDALSAVIEVDKFCKNCRPPLENKLQKRIDRCIESLINNS